MKIYDISSWAKFLLALQKRKRLTTPFNITMGTLLVTLLLIEIVLAKAVHLSGWSAYLDIWFGLLLLSACWFYCILRRQTRLADSVEMAFWVVLINNVLSALIPIAGRSPRPLVDRSLWMIDEKMHFSTIFFVNLVAKIPAVRLVFSLSYQLLGPFVITTLLALFFFGNIHAARRYILGATLALILTIALFALWPASGPWITQNFAPTKEQADVTDYLVRLKTNSQVEVDLQRTAMVSFPSFHVTLAILTAVAFSSFRRLRLWTWILTVLICISTITSGWHYGIDVLGGLAVAGVSIALAGLLKETH
jgi:membrane-associated phospholipid phosphatase